MSWKLSRTPTQMVEAVIQKLRHPEVADDHRRDHLRIVTGPQPYRHSYFALDTFLEPDLERGTIQTIYGQRALLATHAFVRSLVEVLEREAADRAEDLLEKMGRAWAERNWVDLVPRVEQEYEIQFDRMSLGMLFQTWWWPMRAGGWGEGQLDWQHARRGLVQVIVNNSAFVRTLGQKGRPICSWYAGMFAGIFSKLARRDLASVEVECAAAGVDHCTFFIGSPNRIQSTRQARDDGASVETLVEHWLAHKSERVAVSA